MQIIKCLIFALFLQARHYHAEIVITTTSPNKSTGILVEGLVKIVTSCYKHRITAVGLAGNLPDTLSRTLAVQHLIPTVLMGDTNSDIIINQRRRAATKQFRYGLPVFIVGGSSYSHLVGVSESIIDNSMWLNQTASVFILDQSHGCHNAGYFLVAAWLVGFLNSKVMCYHHQYGLLIFNYNPFTNRAPVPWQQAYVLRAVYQHPFTVFDREYQGNEAICVNLDFVKTKDLGRYYIQVDADIEAFWQKLAKDKTAPTDAFQVEFDQFRIATILFRSLNAIPIYTGINGDNLSNYGEITVRPFTMISHTTYPFQTSEIVIVSKFRGHKSQLQKILDILDVDSRIGMGIVYLVTLIFFKFFVRHALGPTLLNLVRITCNWGFVNLPDNNAARMYLTGILFFVVTMQGIFQGDLASLLTSKIPVRNVNSLEDLVNFGYKIYGREGSTTYLERADLKEHFITVDSVDECIAYILNDSLAACIEFTVGGVTDLARQYDLHISTKFVKQVPFGFLIRDAWYLEERVNTILGKLMEADVFENWNTKCNPIKVSDFEFDKEVLGNTDFKIMEFAEVRFAFIMLGIGLLCATVTFIVEIAIYRYQQHKNNTVIIL